MGSNTTDFLNSTTIVPYEEFRSNYSHENVPIFNASKAFFSQFSFVSNNILSPCICLFGIIGNTLGISVLWTDTAQKRVSIYVYLLCLTIVDSIYLFLGLIRNIPDIMKLFDEQHGFYIGEVMKLGTIYLDMVFSFTSRGILIVMSLERLIALVKPLEVKQFYISKCPCKIVTICFLFNVIFLLPFPLYLEVDSYTIGNKTEYFVQFRKDIERDMDVYMLVQTVVDYLIPPILLVFTNIGIPFTYSRIVKRRRNTFNIDPIGAYNQQTKIASTVFFIILLYLLCSLPNLFVKVLAMVDDEYSFDGQHKLVFWFFIDLSNLFEYINAANDSVIYILVSTHHRQVFVRKYCRRCCIRPVDTDSDSTNGTSTLAAISGSQINDI